MAGSIVFSRQSGLLRGYWLQNLRVSIKQYFSVSETNDVDIILKNGIAKSVTESRYGYEIGQTLIVHIEPNENVKKEMNGIDAPARMRVADNVKAEAKKKLQIKRAEGDAESNISGLGVASSARPLLTGSEIVCSHSLVM
ncbi:hypothetical protein OIU84_018904 [Salix udensis]|uniref:Uncharacterized protein n=1 Tax=Salix udensis TaxID=889485 RepID=A0AAD6KXL2_9ROSI|nr:hypothetical protein OIU84_018904 [Salix udensis]